MEQQLNGYADVIVLCWKCIQQEVLFTVVISVTMIAGYCSSACQQVQMDPTLLFKSSDENPDRLDTSINFHQKLIPRLQDEFNFHVMMHGLCFPAGAHITNSIHLAVTTSRKTVVMITKNMLRSHWCNYELMI
ncbi:hypothetical protein RRG08_012337 [Elysia crispata]|uniref:TIR domain-containing protein n=1 Tax=Elysia crispata TaxID=231223 RepID=A0AAE1ADZ0_9GAST|nr:hypothetical protein RRG08_012337 [Elysia crispata]